MNLLQRSFFVAQSRRVFSTSTTTEAKINYAHKTYYQILQVDTAVPDKKLKIAYLKLAKQYHPDVYHGVNQDHFKKVSEAYNTLKNAKKRSEYDNKIKLRA